MLNFIDGRKTKETANLIRKICRETEAMDNDYASQAKSQGKSYQRLFTKTTMNTDSLGTWDSVDNFLQHVEKGCFSDPLPPHEMSYPCADKPSLKGGPPEYNRRRGTNIVESSNKYGRIASVGDATRQRSELSDNRYLAFICKHNLMTNDKIAHLTGKKARPRD